MGLPITFQGRGHVQADLQGKLMNLLGVQGRIWILAIIAVYLVPHLHQVSGGLILFLIPTELVVPENPKVINPMLIHPALKGPSLTGLQKYLTVKGRIPFLEAQTKSLQHFWPLNSLFPSSKLDLYLSILEVPENWKWQRPLPPLRIKTSVWTAYSNRVLITKESGNREKGPSPWQWGHKKMRRRNIWVVPPGRIAAPCTPAWRNRP